MPHERKRKMARRIKVNWGDITLTPIAGGNILRAAVWEGDAQWDLVVRVFGATPTSLNMVF